MATYTDNYNLTKPTMSELADIRTINGNMDTIDEIMHGSQVSIADAYDPTQTYDVDDLVMYGFLLYKCITAVSTPEAFDPTKWERTTAAAEGSGGGGGGGGASLPDYSTMEQNTGRKWIDGKDIYVKTIAWNNVLIQDGSYQHGISGIETVVDHESFCCSTDSSDSYVGSNFFPFKDTTGDLILQRITSSDIVFKGTTYFSPQSYRTWYFTIYYTKTSS